MGKSRAGRQFEDLWAEFFREIEEEIARLITAPAAQNVQADRAASSPRPVHGVRRKRPMPHLPAHEIRRGG